MLSVGALCGIVIGAVLFLFACAYGLLAIFGTPGRSVDPRAAYVRPGVPPPKQEKPKIIMTYWKAPPERVIAMVKEMAPEFELAFFDDDKTRTFLRTYYQDPVLQRFNLYLQRKQYAHAADLMRFCVLSILPGRNLYLDVKTVLKCPVSTWFPLEGDSVLATRSGAVGLCHIGITGGPMEWSGWLAMVDRIMRTPPLLAKLAYHTHCLQFATRCADDRVTWMREECSERNCTQTKKDRYGLCCVVKSPDGDVVMHARDSTYPY